MQVRGNLQEAIFLIVVVMIPFLKRSIMRTTLLFICLHSVLNLAQAHESSSCLYPGSPRHGKLSVWTPDFPNASIAEFECYPGYELIGPKSSECLDGEWSRGIPFCSRDIARGKPVSPIDSSDMNLKNELLVDGDETTCSRPADFWFVNLFERTKVTTVKLVFGANVPASTVSIRIEHERESSNLCAQLKLDIKSHTPYFVKCNPQSSAGSFISVGVESESGPVPLCALEAHSSSALSHEDACPPGYDGTLKDAFNGTCYEFHSINLAPIGDARFICYKNEGQLIGTTPMNQKTLKYLKWRMHQISPRSSFWLDLNSTAAETLMNNTGWTIDGGKGNCYVLSSENGFSRSECESPNYVICAYSIVSCGRPRLPKALLGWQKIDKLRTGRSLKNLRCAEGFYAEMDEPLACDIEGEISGAVRCQKFVCGMPPTVQDGFPRATSNHTVEYECSKGKFIQGDSRVVCDVASQKWSVAPTCGSFFEFFKSWFQAGKDSFQRIGDLPLAGQLAVIAGLASLAVVVLFGIFYRIHIVRQRRGIKVGREPCAWNRDRVSPLSQNWN